MPKNKYTIEEAHVVGHESSSGLSKTTYETMVTVSGEGDAWYTVIADFDGSNLGVDQVILNGVLLTVWPEGLERYLNTSALVFNLATAAVDAYREDDGT